MINNIQNSKQKNKNGISKFFIRAKNFAFFDLLLFILFALIAVGFLYFLLRRSEYVTVTLRVSSSDSLSNHWFNRPAQWYLEALEPGLQSIDLLGRPIVSVLQTYYYPTYSNVETFYVQLNVRAVYNKNTNEFSYNGVPLLVGKFVDFNVGGVLVKGVIHNINADSVNSVVTKKYLVSGELEYINNGRAQEEQAELEGIRTYIAEDLKEGVTYTDSTGREYAKIVDITKQPAYKKIVHNTGFVSILDPERQKVFLTVEIEVDVIKNVPHYIGEFILRKGGIIPLYGEYASTFLTLHEITELETL
jgi:hypothetical protein